MFSVLYQQLLVPLIILTVNLILDRGWIRRLFTNNYDYLIILPLITRDFPCIFYRLNCKLNITWKTIQDGKNVRAAKVWVPLLKNMQNSVNFKDAGLNTATESGDWITYEIHVALITVLHVFTTFFSTGFLILKLECGRGFCGYYYTKLNFYM